jgi:hypothetical protein
VLELGTLGHAAERLNEPRKIAENRYRSDSYRNKQANQHLPCSCLSSGQLFQWTPLMGAIASMKGAFDVIAVTF